MPFAIHALTFFLSLAVSPQFASGTGFKFFPPSCPHLPLDSRVPYSTLLLSHVKFSSLRKTTCYWCVKCLCFSQLLPQYDLNERTSVMERERYSLCSSKNMQLLVGLFVQNKGQRRSIDLSNKVTEGLAYTTSACLMSSRGESSHRGSITHRVMKNSITFHNANLEFCVLDSDLKMLKTGNAGVTCALWKNNDHVLLGQIFDIKVLMFWSLSIS